MAVEVAVRESPGGLPDSYQCPYCSRMYLSVMTENGEPTKVTAEPPSACVRCGSPMDLAKAQAFQDKQAELGAAPAERVQRRTVKI